VRYRPPDVPVAGTLWSWSELEVAAREQCSMQAARKNPNPHGDGRQFCHGVPRARIGLRSTVSKPNTIDRSPAAGWCPSVASTLGVRTCSGSGCSSRSLVEPASLSRSCLLTGERGVVTQPVGVDDESVFETACDEDV